MSASDDENLLDRTERFFGNVADSAGRIDQSVSTIADRSTDLRNLVGVATDQVRGALGLQSAEDQLIGNTIIAGVIIATSAVGLLGTLALLPLVALWFTLGLLRFWEPFNNLWPLSDQ